MSENVDRFLDQLDHLPDVSSPIEVRSAARREIGMRIVPWEVPVMTRNGPEVVMRGAFDGVDPSTVVLRLEHENPAAGKGISYENRADGAYMIFRASKTQRGDDILTLAEDGVTNGVSVGYRDVDGGTEIHTRGGKRLRVVHRGNLAEVSTTWQPTWKEAEVQFVRSDEEGEKAMPDVPVTEAPETPAIDITPLNAAIESMGTRVATTLDTFGDRIAAIEERSRRDIIIPGRDAATPRVNRGEWTQIVLRAMSGERVSEIQMRTLDDLVTGDNLGVVPEAFLSDMVGIIDASRPFLGSTRRLDLPPSGMTLNVPVIETRPTAGPQVNGSGTPTEKADIVSTATSITSEGFDAVTIAGGGDISLQLLKRSSPSYLGLYLELLAEAVSSNAEDAAIAALFDSTISPGGTIDPENLLLGDAWANGADVKKPPNTIWMSTAAVGAFIDAKADGTNMPLYSTIQAGFTAAAGTAGTISGLRPIHVPALDATDTDVIVGPSTGFGWTEDGTYTLQVDVPSKAGRDVALVTILWFAPLYPTAFTGYTLGS